MKRFHEKGLCLFTSLLLVLYILTGLFLTSCGVKETEQPETADHELRSGTDETKVTNMVSDNTSSNEGWTELNYSLGALPEPDSGYEADWGIGIYYSDISYSSLEQYLDQLISEGFQYVNGEKSANKLGEGITQLMLSDGENLLQLMITVGSKENSMVNSVLIRREEGSPAAGVKDRKGAISKEEAADLIQPELNRLIENGQLSESRSKIAGIFELFIRDAYEKMGLQAFSVISETGVTGSFLVCNGRVLFVNGNLSETCVADLDGNGKYELLDLFGWGFGIYRIELSAYEFSNPVYFNSLTEVLHRKYYNCFVPDKGYDILKFNKISDSEVRLVGASADYGRLLIDNSYLVPGINEGFPFREWRNVFDQSGLPGVDKKIPEKAPEIVISVDGRSLDYIAQETKWDGKENPYDTSELFKQILNQDNFIPTYCVGGDTPGHYVELNFGKSIPDSIQVKDAMMEENGRIRYGSKLMMDREVEIMDNSRVRFGLTQNMAYYLSSYSGDYEKDWYRIFHVICTWGEKEAVYTFVLNTGSKESVTELENHAFLTCDGSFSMLSSSWGIGLQVNIDKAYLPEDYIIEWQADTGELRTWREEYLKPIYITAMHHGYPMTSSADENGGAVIWSPVTYETGDEAVIRAYVYRSPEDKSPVAYSELTLICEDGIWKEE